MGLDILLGATNQAVLDTVQHSGSHSLSRTFCNFMSRQGVVEGEPELDQIGQLTGIDISPLYQMEKYVLDEDLQSWLEFEDEADRPEIIQQIEADRASLEGNIDSVIQTVNHLLQKLATVDNLPQLLTANGHDTLNHQVYFTDFTTDKGDGYIGNNFGQDLRNFKNFLDFAKSHGTSTVFFVYG